MASSASSVSSSWIWEETADHGRAALGKHKKKKREVETIKNPAPGHARASAAYIVHLEEGVVLGHDGVLGLGQDMDEVVSRQAVQADQDREPPHKLGDEPKLHLHEEGVQGTCKGSGS
jgi:hypothetical protein